MLLLQHSPSCCIVINEYNIFSMPWGQGATTSQGCRSRMCPTASVNRCPAERTFSVRQCKHTSTERTSRVMRAVHNPTHMRAIKNLFLTSPAPTFSRPLPCSVHRCSSKLYMKSVTPCPYRNASILKTFNRQCTVVLNSEHETHG